VSGFSRFEDIGAWKRSRELARLVYRLTGAGLLSRDFTLRDQMRRAAVSAVSNIAEGFERGGTGEFRQFLSQAKGSAAELRAQLYVAHDAGLIDDDQFDEAHRMAEETGRMIGGLIKYLARTDIRGAKYR
jgi:four helix bundle protein